MGMKEKICVYCGNSFLVDETKNTSMKRKYCSPLCATDMENQRKRERREKAKAGEEVEYHRECLQCGKKFKTVAYQKTYCSGLCREKASSDRQKTYGVAYREKRRQEKEAKKKAESLVEFDRKAKEAGLSYGKYSEMLLIKEMQKQRKGCKDGQQKNVHKEDNRQRSVS